MVLEGSLECLQMVLPPEVALPAATCAAEALSGERAAEMGLARALHRELGFKTVRSVMLHRLVRDG
jgi:hypothetical protein